MAANDGLAEIGSTSLRWDELEKLPPSGERLTVRKAFPGRSGALLIGIDATAHRHLLVEIPEGEPAELVERTSRGIGVNTIEMNTGGGVMKVFVDIACLESYGEQSIDMIAVELVTALEAGASINRVALVQNVLSKWRRFWSGMSQGLLSKEQQLGLFGELWFLSRWLAPAVGFPRATAIWRGPLGARNDFESPTMTVEVKTTSRLDRTCKINGIEQLMAPANGILFLFGLEVREEASSSDTMPALIDEIRSGLAEDYELLSRFDTCLYAADYLDELAREYGMLKLRVKREELFEVNGDFPRLTPNSLLNGMPPGVSGVTYELNLGAAAPWHIASNAVEAFESIRANFRLMP